MKVLDLFSGIGGFSVGLERAGMKTVAFCEFDKRARLVLHKHWPDVPVFHDVRELKGEHINETIDVICGGFPCQDISVSGKGAGLAGERSGLWFEFHRLIKEIRPKYAIIENVSALRSRGLEQVLWSLAEIGYDAEWHCIPASAVGAPHQRDRIWIVAYPNSLRELQSEGSEPHEWKRIGNRSEDVADTLSAVGWGGASAGEIEEQRWPAAISGGEGIQSVNREACPDKSEQSGEDVAYANGAQLQGGSIPSRILAEDTDFGSGRWWEIEPAVGRVAYGVPNWSHRLKQLGNAVVPQIPELIGNAIMRHHVKIISKDTNRWHNDSREREGV